ncbi:MAG: type II secretion system protein [Kiritimatiellae bacterium]|nr:type II secretion system protein [Kiritimatiellia bacterium]
MKRRGFTIIELLVVVGIISVLATIVTVTASGSVKSTRTKRRAIMADVLREGIATYYARNGKWPGGVESYAKNGTDHTFQGSEADPVFQEVVKGSVKKTATPYLNPHGLFVAPVGEAASKNARGLNFDEAIRKNPPKHYRHLNVNQMAFGYQNPTDGKFVRYRIKYTASTDSVNVTYPSDSELRNM